VSVRKIREGEDGGLVDGSDCSSPPLHPFFSIARRNDLSPSECAGVREGSEGVVERAETGEIILFRNRYGPTTILSHPHRSPTVEVALAVAKVAAGVVVDGVEGRRRGGIRRRRSESNSNGASRRLLGLLAYESRRGVSIFPDFEIFRGEPATRSNSRGARQREMEAARLLGSFRVLFAHVCTRFCLFLSLHLGNW